MPRLKGVRCHKDFTMENKTIQLQPNYRYVVLLLTFPEHRVQHYGSKALKSFSCWQQDKMAARTKALRAPVVAGEAASVCLQVLPPTGRPSTCWLSRTSSLPHAQLLHAIRRWRWKRSTPLSTPPSPITWQAQSVDDWLTPQPPRRLQGMKLSPWPPAIFHSFYVIYERLTAACSPSVCVSHSEAGNCHLLVLKRLLLTSQSHVWLWAFCQLLLNT